MRHLFFAALLWVTVAPALAAPAYEQSIVTTAQEALVRLGYDPGPIDGAWGAKAREAMNALRAAHGLPPAKDFVGSSLALVHRLSPGPTTLPNPGILIGDPALRQSALPKLRSAIPGRSLCQTKLDDVTDLGDILEEKPIEKVSTSSSPQRGYITSSDDWNSPLLKTMMVAHNTCVLGKPAGACDNIVQFMSDWAEADALKPGAKKSQRAFDDVSWIGNSLVRNFIFAYADARRLVQVDAVKDAEVLDWFKRRIDDYDFTPSAGDAFGSPTYVEAGNHAMANKMSAQAFGALVGDRSMMQGALDTWTLVVDNMREDGSMPTETRRGARSLHYSNFQIGQLIASEEMARAQGIDLFSSGSKYAEAIPKAVSFVLDAYEDFDKVKPYAKANEGSPSKDYSIPFMRQFHLGWLPAYRMRFGDDENIVRMREIAIDERICSKGAMSEEKLPEEACTKDKGRPLLRNFIVLWETADLEWMGYSAACLQGLTPYTLLPIQKK